MRDCAPGARARRSLGAWLYDRVDAVDERTRADLSSEDFDPKRPLGT